MQASNKHFIILIGIAIFSFLLPKITFALGCSEPMMAAEPQVDWPASPFGGYELNKDSTIADLVGYFFGWGIGLGGLAVFITLIIAGVQYITSVADPGKVQEAKNRIKSSVIGLALLLSSWAIFSLINPNLIEMESNFNMISTGIESETCTNASDCCDPNNSECVPKNWKCCQANDENCIKTGISTDPTGTLGIGEPCVMQEQCDSRLCGCNYGVDPTTYKKTDWESICLPNPTVCIENANAQELGCDKIIFYSQVDFGGTPVELEEIGGKINGGWAWFNTGFEPKSYQAFYKERDNKGNETGEFKPCGYLACGCRINRCLDTGQNAGGSDCITNTADKNSGEFTEYVYSESNFETISGVRIDDPTKATGVSDDKDKSWWDKLFGN